MAPSGDDLSFNLEAVMHARGSFYDALQQLGCKVTRGSLELTATCSEENWLQAGLLLRAELEADYKRVDEIQWLVGDWWRQGGRYGARTAEARKSGLCVQTCINWANVAKKFEPNRRRLGRLSFTHHAEVAHLPPKEADRLLDWAEEPSDAIGAVRSTRELRDEAYRHRIASMARIPSFPSIEPSRAAVVLEVESAAEPKTATYALLRVPEVPRLEPEVRQQLGQSPAEAQRQRLSSFRAGLQYAKRELPPDVTVEEFGAAIEDTKQLLDWLMEQRRQLGGGNLLNLR